MYNKEKKRAWSSSVWWCPYLDVGQPVEEETRRECGQWAQLVGRASCWGNQTRAAYNTAEKEEPQRRITGPESEGRSLRGQ